MAGKNRIDKLPVGHVGEDSDIDIRVPDGPGSEQTDLAYDESAERSVPDVAGGKLELPPHPHRQPAVRPRPPVKKLVQLKPKDHGPLSDALRDKAPHLAAYLYEGSWDDLNPREGSTMTVKASGGIVFLTLKCPTEGEEVTATGLGLFQALGVLERYCATNEGPWKEMKYGTGVQKRRDARKKESDKRKNVEYDIPPGGGEDQ